MNKEQLADWLKLVLSGLVTTPDEIGVAISTDEQGVLFVIKVAKVDTGKIIGKNGTIASAIRTILRSAGFNGDMRVSMKIDAPAYTPKY